MIDPEEQQAALQELAAAQELTDEQRAEIAGHVTAGAAALEERLCREGGGKSESEQTDVRLKISSMKLPDKIKAAMFGNEVCRAILINDSNRIVQSFVLKNPKLQLGEIEAFVKNPNLSEYILRQIASKKEWLKSYMVKYGLVLNPKSPPDLALKWLRFLHDADLKKLAKSKNVPQIVAISARKRLAEEAKKK